MKICVVGAGAIGGYMAVHLSLAGHEVSVVARGPHLAAIKTHGLKLIENDEILIADSLIATNSISDLSEQDVVLLALKAHQIEPIVDSLSSLLGKNTVIVTLQNGIPWWYFQKLPGEFAIGHNRYSTTGGTTLRNVQPFFADTNAGGIAIAHNGNLTNAITLRKKLVEDGAIFYSTSDTETIIQLIAKSTRERKIDKIIDTFQFIYIVFLCQTLRRKS